MKDDLKDILLTEEEIQEICKDLGEQLTRDYKDKPLVCVGILKGSVMFMADLIKRIDTCLLYTSPSPRDKRQARMPSSA